MKTFTSKPSTIRAFQFTDRNALRCWSVPFEVLEGGGVVIWVAASKSWCQLNVGDYVVREPDGSGFYPCKQEIFEARWETSDA